MRRRTHIHKSYCFLFPIYRLLLFFCTIDFFRFSFRYPAACIDAYGRAYLTALFRLTRQDAPYCGASNISIHYYHISTSYLHFIRDSFWRDSQGLSCVFYLGVATLTDSSISPQPHIVCIDTFHFGAVVDAARCMHA